MWVDEVPGKPMRISRDPLGETHEVAGDNHRIACVFNRAFHGGFFAMPHNREQRVRDIVDHKIEAAKVIVTHDLRCDARHI